MKKAFLPLAALVLFQAAPAHAETRLASLDCVANNGVTIKSTGDATATGLAVESSWGLFAKKFTARVGVTALDANSYIELVNDKTKKVEYYLALEIKHDTAEEQKVIGSIVKPSLVGGLPPAVVAIVECNVKVK